MYLAALHREGSPTWAQPVPYFTHLSRGWHCLATAGDPNELQPTSPAPQGAAAQPSTPLPVPLQCPAPRRDCWTEGSSPPPVLPCLAGHADIITAPRGGRSRGHRTCALTLNPAKGVLQGTGCHRARSCCTGRGGSAACAPVHAPKLNGIIHLFWLQKDTSWKSCEACPDPAAALFPGMAGTDRRGVTRRWSRPQRALGLSGDLRLLPKGEGTRHPVCQQLALPTPTATQGWEVAPATQGLHCNILADRTKLLAPSSWPGQVRPGRSQQCS